LEERLNRLARANDELEKKKLSSDNTVKRQTKELDTLRANLGDLVSLNSAQKLEWQSQEGKYKDLIKSLKGQVCNREGTVPLATYKSLFESSTHNEKQQQEQVSRLKKKVISLAKQLDDAKSEISKTSQVEASHRRTVAKLRADVISLTRQLDDALSKRQSSSNQKSQRRVTIAPKECTVFEFFDHPLPVAAPAVAETPRKDQHKPSTSHFPLRSPLANGGENIAAVRPSTPGKPWMDRVRKLGGPKGLKEQVNQIRSPRTHREAVA
jgi:DNA repair exonuclease SbcCD ATPase subunit